MRNIRITYEDALGNNKEIRFSHLQEFLEYIQGKREEISLDKVRKTLEDKCIFNEYVFTSNDSGHITYYLPEDEEVEIKFSRWYYRGTGARLTFGRFGSELRFVRVYIDTHKDKDKNFLLTSLSYLRVGDDTFITKNN